MSDNQNLNNLGDQIKGAVTEALGTGDFKKLNSIITDTVSTALSDAGLAGSKAWQQKEEWKQRQSSNPGSNYSPEYWRQLREARMEQQRQQQVQERRAIQQAQAAYARQKKAPSNMVPVKNVGLASGILSIVFSSIAIIPFLVFFILASTGVFQGGVLLWGALMAAAIYLIVHGTRKIGLISRAKRYVKLCGAKCYADMDELAAQTGNSVRKIRKDIKKILSKGILPTARMDKQGKCLMLNETLYRQYLEAEQAKVRREVQEQQKTPSELVSEARTKQQQELDSMMAVGRDYIKKLRDMNDAIEGEVISNKLYQLENILKEIFSKVEKEPDQMHRMKKVMEYYLPTTLKLVEAYKEYDTVSTPTQEMLSAKAEIEKTIDSINQAFVELLNTLFQDSIFDVTTDAQVLQTMLAREGLTRELEPVKVSK